jgi:hypothetical protein
MSRVRTTWRPRARLILTCLAAVLAVAAASPAIVAAAPPPDEYYPQSVQPKGWLKLMGWDWATLEKAHESGDAAFPTIAVIDSGLDVQHPEFRDDRDAIHPSSADCTRRSPRLAVPAFSRLAPFEGEYHGTKVAGLAAAPANGVGIVGASPFSSILPVRITKGLVGLPCALRHLARLSDQGATGLLVVNLSVEQAREPGAAVQNAIDALVRRGALIVAATGNVGAGFGSRLAFPARLPHVLAVGDSEGRTLLPGPELDLRAPGAGMWLPDVNDSWSSPDTPQTSWSTALVSGAAAAVWGAHTEAMTAQQLAYVLRASARGGNWSPRTGFGTVNIARALQMKPPRDDEVEPNDTARDARHPDSLDPLSCLRPCLVNGILGRTDDPADWWRVRKPPSRTVCARTTGAVRASVRPGPRGYGYVRVTTQRRLAGYSLSIRFC